MAKTTLIEYGTSVIAGAYDDEEIVPVLGNAAAIPGDSCSIHSDRKVAPTKTGTTDLFTGFLLESRITGREAAPGAGIREELVVPKSGKRYNVRCKTDVNVEIGGGLDFSATDYKLDAAADIIHAVCTAAKPIATGDSVAHIRWR